MLSLLYRFAVRSSLSRVAPDGWSSEPFGGALEEWMRALAPVGEPQGNLRVGAHRVSDTAERVVGGAPLGDGAGFAVGGTQAAAMVIVDGGIWQMRRADEDASHCLLEGGANQVWRSQPEVLPRWPKGVGLAKRATGGEDMTEAMPGAVAEAHCFLKNVESLPTSARSSPCCRPGLTVRGRRSCKVKRCFLPNPTLCSFYQPCTDLGLQVCVWHKDR